VGHRSPLWPAASNAFFDNRGLGASQPVRCRLTIEQMAEDTLALMDARGWRSAYVIGHSVGGLIGHVALSAHATHINALLLEHLR
jgi:pimeloyl-ACP methyl ester carboxylesterase